MKNPNALDEFADRWLGQTVRFKLLGQQVEGKVIEIVDSVCTGPHFVIAEFRDGSKQVKVGAPYQAFRRISQEGSTQ